MGLELNEHTEYKERDLGYPFCSSLCSSLCVLYWFLSCSPPPSGAIGGDAHCREKETEARNQRSVCFPGVTSSLSPDLVPGTLLSDFYVFLIEFQKQLCEMASTNRWDRSEVDCMDRCGGAGKLGLHRPSAWIRPPRAGLALHVGGTGTDRKLMAQLF